MNDQTDRLAEIRELLKYNTWDTIRVADAYSAAKDLLVMLDAKEIGMPDEQPEPDQGSVILVDSIRALFDKIQIGDKVTVDPKLLPRRITYIGCKVCEVLDKRGPQYLNVCFKYIPSCDVVASNKVVWVPVEAVINHTPKDEPGHSTV